MLQLAKLKPYKINKQFLSYKKTFIIDKILIIE